MEVFFSPIEQILKIKEKAHNALNRLNVFCLRDLVFSKPIGYELYHHQIPSEFIGEMLVQIPVIINSLSQSSRYILIKTTFQDIAIDLIFFSNIPVFIRSILKTGTKFFVMGKLKYDFGRYQIVHPEFVLNKRFRKSIIPKYSLSYGLNNLQLYNYILSSLEHVRSHLEESTLDLNIRRYYTWLYKILQHLHFNDLSLDTKNLIIEQKNAVMKLSLEELFVHQFSLKNFFLQKQTISGKRIIFPNKKIQKSILDRLNFSLTRDQRTAISEIEKDQQSSIPMMRLLQGDVGSGKTLVAMLTILNVVSCTVPGQAALVAPTDILSKQHFQLFSTVLKDTGIRVEIITGATTKKRKEILKKDLAEGKISILIGTHSLLQQDVVFHDLVYVVIDEQHRFGVKQRLLLIEKASTTDVLIMSATPIPRSLTLAMFGNIKISKLHGVASGYRKISTYLVSNKKTRQVIDMIKGKIEQGQKSFWICPFIEQVEDNEYLSHITNVKDRYQVIANHYPNQVGIIHGSMKRSEQDKVIHQLVNGEILVLVSTTVIEVGIDIKLSSLMVIENAERFGLSQLHQLRGRIGRDGTKSDCVLLYDHKFCSQAAKQRLSVMKKTNDGFTIAQKDLEIRGHGEIMGLKQSGQINFFFANLEQDYFLIDVAEKMAQYTDISQVSYLKAKLFMRQEENYIKSL